MKNIRILLTAFTASVIAFSSCTKITDISLKEISGSYKGTLINVSSFKSSTDIIHDSTATADVEDLGNGLMRVHCYGSEFDTTFMLNYYANHDSLGVCATGEAFQHMYGHNMSPDSTWNYNGMGSGGMGSGGMGSGGMGSGGMGSGGNNQDSTYTHSNWYNTASSSDTTAWSNHMNASHKQGERHFGGFDMTNGTFGYTFERTNDTLFFQGRKQ